jgi:malonyl-CoA/methylmalonyl-CoA synthetase
VVPGDRVAVQTDKTPQAVMLYLATLKAGAIFLPLNTAYTAAEVEYFLTDAEPRLFVQDATALAAEAQAHPPLETTVPRADDDLASIIYTSGTTGRSKGAMLTHGALYANAQALHDTWGFSADDVLLHALPIFHVHGLFVALHCAFLSGAPMVWLAKFEDAPVLAGLARSTVMMGVPTFYTRLLSNPGFTREAAAHMRLFISGSAPLLESTFAEFEQRTGMRILERYGMSEAVIITSNPLNGERLAGSVGYPLPGVSLRIGGGEATGGIEIKGVSVFSGYWRMPEKTAEDFTADGWFMTGDVGRQDQDGRVWISGRAKDLIISGGYNVYPKEIELILDELPGVTESAVIGLPHPDFGEAVAAVVIGAGDETAMIATLRQQLAAFKAPKRIFFVDELPRNAMGKVQKNLLRQTYAGTFTA